MAPTSSQNSTSTQQWLPLSNILGRMACCAVPTNTVTDLVIMEDYTDDTAIERPRPRPRQPLSFRNNINDLPSPTLSPARRDLDRWEPPPSCYAESTVTSSTFPDDDDDYHLCEEIKSNATTEVVSHRQRQLLANTLAAAERQLRMHHEERRQDAEDLQKFSYLMRLQPENGKQHL